MLSKATSVCKVGLKWQLLTVQTYLMIPKIMLRVRDKGTKTGTGNTMTKNQIYESCGLTKSYTRYEGTNILIFFLKLVQQTS